MPRVKRGVITRRRHNKILRLAKGYWGRKSKTFKNANEAVLKAGQDAYRGRKQRKRDFRRLWIVRINAAARQHGLSYSQLICGLSRAGIELDRKQLSEMAVHDAVGFEKVCETAAQALQQS